MKNSLYNQKNRCRRGLTLIELLVVAGLMILLISVAAPVLNPVAEGRQAREAVRGIQGALETARSRAMRLGRPCGVAFPAFSNDEDKNDKNKNTDPVCIQLEQLTAPPDIVVDCTVSGNSITVNDPLYSQQGDADLLQINYTGPWYRKKGKGATWSTYIPGTSIALGYPDGNYEGVIRRSPVSESGNAFAKILGLDPVFMIPRGIVVDLAYSGIGNDGTWGKNVKQISIIFQPDGTVSLFYDNTVQDLSSSENSHIFLLVGRWDRGISAAEDNLHNYQDPNSFWVVINTQTGMVTSAINNALSGDASVSQSREYARNTKKIMGGH